MSQKPLRPEKIMTAGAVFILAALLIGVAAWGSITLLRQQPDAPAGQTLPANPPQAGTPQAGAAWNATQVGAFLGLPTQPLQPQPTLAPAPAAEASPAPGVDIEHLLAEMSLEEKIGQMIMAGVPGQALSPEVAKLVAQDSIGSIVYFGENTETPEQVRQYSQALQDTAAASGRGIPLLIAVDHEGGRVFRFKSGLTHFPNPMALGAARSTDLAFRVAAENALELKSVGVNLDLAPVVDINDEPLNPVIGLRAFGGYADLVSAIGSSYILGVQNNGVVAAAKHFPGHGSTKIDSHEALPVVDKSLAELEQNELVPFRAAVDAGVAVVMVGHIALPQVDPSGMPASLSPVIIQQLLRQKLGYDGVVMTDAMSMGAVAGQYSLAEAAVAAVNAGCDLVAYTSADAAVTARSILLQAVRSGRIPSDRVDQSARRVLALKAKFGLFSRQPAGPAANYDTGAALAQEMARQSISMVGAARPPLVQTSSLLLVSPDSLPAGSRGGDGLSLLGELLTAAGIQVDEWIYPADDAEGLKAIQDQALGAFRSYPAAVVVTSDALLQQANGNGAQVDLVRAFLASGKPVIIVAAGSPFDLALVSGSAVGLATYGGLDVQMRSLSEALLSPSAPPGVLPIPLSR